MRKKRNSKWANAECRRQPKSDRLHRSPLTISSREQSTEKPQRGLVRYVRRTPPNERDAWNDTRARTKTKVEQHQIARNERDQRHRRNDAPEHKHGRGRPRERDHALPENNRIAGPTSKDIKKPKNDDEPHKDAHTRMNTSPTPTPKRIRRDAPAFKPYQSEKQPKHERHAMREKQPAGRNTAPRYDDPPTHMGAQLATSELIMRRALLSELDDAALKDAARDRITLGGNAEKPECRTLLRPFTINNPSPTMALQTK